jgi:hypothetical protein
MQNLGRTVPLYRMKGNLAGRAEPGKEKKQEILLAMWPIR